MPLLVFYLFGVWAVLIVLAAVLARRLDPPAPPSRARRRPRRLPPA